MKGTFTDLAHLGTKKEKKGEGELRLRGKYRVRKE